MTKIVEGKKYKMVKVLFQGRKRKVLITWGYPCSPAKDYASTLTFRENQIVITEGKPFLQGAREVVFVYLENSENNKRSRFTVATQCLEPIFEKDLYFSPFSGKWV